jgi:hypothetical protein
MRLYSSFLIRCWLTDDPGQDKQSILQVEHIQTGASARAQSLSEIEPWIFDACRGLKTSADATSEANASEQNSNERDDSRQSANTTAQPTGAE